MLSLDCVLPIKSDKILGLPQFYSPKCKNVKKNVHFQNIDYHIPQTLNNADGFYIMSPPEFNLDKFPFLSEQSEQLCAINKGVCTSDIFIEQNDVLLSENVDKLIDEQIDVQ